MFFAWLPKTISHKKTGLKILFFLVWLKLKTMACFFRSVIFILISCIQQIRKVDIENNKKKGLENDCEENNKPLAKNMNKDNKFCLCKWWNIHSKRRLREFVLLYIQEKECKKLTFLNHRKISFICKFSDLKLSSLLFLVLLIFGCQTLSTWPFFPGYLYLLYRTLVSG